jgi:hypothetical protein
MPVDPLYSDSPLLQGSKTDYCPKTSTDVSFISELGYPVITDLSIVRLCRQEYFKTGEGDQYLYNTEGCCVLDISARNCHDIAGVDATEENNYYMGLHYLSVTDPSKGERKICYTTPIRKKKVNVMDLLTKVLQDIVVFIVMVLVAACYEYWIIYGKCGLGGIQTTLYESPYNVGNHTKKNTTSKPSTPSQIECPGGNTEATSNDTGFEWYDTFPYNLITLLNNNEGYNGSTKDTSKTFAFSELAKIPARSLLLGFFYCIIFSRIFMMGLIGGINKYIGSYIYTKDPNKYSQFFSGLIFVVVFMGIYGSLADKFITTKQPFLNASSLLILSIIIVYTVWLPSLLSFGMMMLTFVGYRRGTYDKEKAERHDPPENKKREVTIDNLSDSIYIPWDWHWVIEMLFTLKKNITDKKPDKDKDMGTLYTIDSKNNLEIINENDLDWFFPIHRSKMEVSWRSEWVEAKLSGLINIKNFQFFRHGCTVNSIPTGDYGGLAHYYWWLSHYADEPMKLFDLYSPLEVDCQEVKEVSNKRGLFTRIGFAFFATFIISIPLIRCCIFWIYVAWWLFCMFILALWAIIWTFIVITIVMYSIFVALLGNIFALFYLHFYVIIGFFYVPFKRYPELLKIIKSHGNILTLLFCMIVILAGVKVLHPTSVGVIGGILGLLVLYKIITLLSV